MAHITPDNFNMYISSLKLSTEMANKYGPQLTQVSLPSFFNINSELVLEGEKLTLKTDTTYRCGKVCK